MLYSRFSLVIYFIHVSVHMSVEFSVFAFSYQNVTFLKQRNNDYGPKRIQPSRMTSRVGQEKMFSLL